MWHRLKNLIFSLKTYDDLSPDLRVRRHVNHALRERPALSLEQWFETFYQPQGVIYPVAEFVYTHFAGYSGLEFARVLPTDQLEEDLCWTQVCWFDWQLNFHDHFQQQFGVDLSECWDDAQILTVKEVLMFLNQQSTQTLNS